LVSAKEAGTYFKGKDLPLFITTANVQ